MSYVYLAAAAGMGASLLQALRWKLVLRKPEIKYIKYLFFIYLGYFFRAFLPGALSGDVAKIYLFSKKYNESVFKSGLVFISQIMGLSFQWIIGLFGLFIYRDSFSRAGFFRMLQLDTGGTVGILIGVMFIFLILYFMYPRLKTSKHLKSIKDDIYNPGLMTKITLVTLMLQFIAFLTTWLLFQSAGVDMNYFQMTLLLAIVHSILYMPVSIAGIGIGEFIYIFLFSEIFSYSRESVLSAAVLGYGLALFFSISGGLWLLSRKLQEKT